MEYYFWASVAICRFPLAEVYMLQVLFSILYLLYLNTIYIPQYQYYFLKCLRKNIVNSSYCQGEKTCHLGYPSCMFQATFVFHGFLTLTQSYQKSLSQPESSSGVFSVSGGNMSKWLLSMGPFTCQNRIKIFMDE